MAFIFFPGTLLHELSHALMAHLLFVPVHRMEFFPKLEGEHIKLGSISIEKTDILRSILIGMAPFLIGTSLLLILLFYGVKNHLFENLFVTIFLGYIVFEVGNTMFSSKKDLEGAIELLLLIASLVGACYLLGLRIPAINLEAILTNPLLKDVFQKGSIFLLVPLGLDLILIAPLNLLKSHK